LADRPSSNDSSSSGRDPGGNTKPDGQAPGLGEQFGRTRSAILGLISAHIKLAKAEFSEIGDQIKHAAALGGIAALLLFLAGMLIVIGLLLFLGEAIFGSIGWGLLDGAELLLGMAALLIFAIIDLGWGRAFTAFVVGLGVGLVVTGVLVVDWSSISHNNSGLPAAWVLAALAGAVIVGILGAVLASAFGRGVAFGGLILGGVSGFLVGLLASAGPGARVAAAVGVATLLLFWPLVAAYLVFRHGVDTDKLRKRFVPEQTIETTKETIEWVREQMPHGRKS
jgi:uncharacterized membrane protein YqjE